MSLIELVDVHKSYRMGPDKVKVLKGVSITIHQGEFVAIIGASGSGKSTLLHIAGALDEPDAGDVLFQDESLKKMPSSYRHRLRNTQFGFVFQFYHLLPELNVLENVLLPVMVKEHPIMFLFGIREQRQEAIRLLEEFGLKDRLKHRPSQLSGGERQRVAIARALINQPSLLLADEPTGNLDSKTGRTILDVLLRLHRQRQQSLLLVTHDPHVAALADRVVELQDGRIATSNGVRKESAE